MRRDTSREHVHSKVVTTFFGQWENNTRNGHGVRCDADGTVYNGQFRYDVPHGYGEESGGDGGQLSGHWAEGHYSASKTSEVRDSVQQARKAVRLAKAKHEKVVKVVEDANMVAAHASLRAERARKEQAKARSANNL